MKYKQAAMQLWNSVAAEHGTFALPTADHNLTMRLIRDYQMCDSGKKVLDIGCGAGKYAIALAQCGALVTATDFSANMLEEAKRCAGEFGADNIVFSHDDWMEVDLRDKGWNHAFDLVLCNMTPAITDKESFLQAMNASRGWILVTKPCWRKNSILDRLAELLGLDEKPSNSAGEEHIFEAFAALWEQGLHPRLEYDQQEWNIVKPLDRAVPYYINRLELHYTLTGEQKEQVSQYLNKIAVDGEVVEHTHTVVTALFCKTGLE